MKKLIIFFSVFVFVSCQRTVLINEKENLSNRIIKKAANEIKKYKKLTPIGTVAQMMDEVKVLGLIFHYYEKLDITEGREMIIYAAQTLVEKINEEKRIHPYLYLYPFPPQRTEIRIFLYNPDRSPLPPGELSIISLADGIIKYKMEDLLTTRLKTIYKETYEEALGKVKIP